MAPKKQIRIWTTCCMNKNAKVFWPWQHPEMSSCWRWGVWGTPPHRPLGRTWKNTRTLLSFRAFAAVFDGPACTSPLRKWGQNRCAAAINFSMFWPANCSFIFPNLKFFLALTDFRLQAGQLHAQPWLIFSLEFRAARLWFLSNREAEEDRFMF